MKQFLKILFTPFMAILGALAVAVGWFYFTILVKLYDFAWKGWEDK